MIKLPIKISFWPMVATITGLLVVGSVVVALSLPSSRGSIVSVLRDKFSGGLRSDRDRTEDNETGAGVIVDVEEKEIADEKPDLIIGGKSQVKDNSAIPHNPPLDQAPWGQGPSDQKALPNK